MDTKKQMKLRMQQTRTFRLYEPCLLINDQMRLEHLGEEALVVHKQVVVEAELTDDLDEVQLCHNHLLVRISL